MSVRAARAPFLAFAALIAISLQPARAEQPSAPTTAAAGQPPQTRRAPATGSIAGTVTSSVDGSPLARARVTLRSAILPYPRVGVTDARGAFSFDRLPGGGYELTVTRTGFALPHAAGGPRGMAVRLGDGETRRGVGIALQRTGTIPGRVLDEDGTPLAGAEVEALSLRGADPQDALVTTATARTDDRGDFRLTGLPAGQYFVVARDPAFIGVGDESGSLRYASTYYPGVLSSSEAQPVSVAEGRETARIEYRLRIVRPARVSGIMLSPARRQLLNGALILIPRDVTVAAALPAEDVELLPNGRFTFKNVAPGRYQLRARAEVDPRGVMLFASYALTVEEGDIGNVSMPLVPGAIVQGSITWESDAASRPRSYSGLRVRAPFADGTSFGDSLTGDVNSTGTFRVRGVMPGRHFFVVEGLREPWGVVTITFRGRNILDQPVDVREGERLQDLRVGLSASTSELHGTVRDESGRLASDTLVVTTAPTLLWSTPANPRFHTTRTDQDGRYRLKGLIAGEYKVAAVAGMDELMAHRRESIERLTTSGFPVTIGARDVREIDLTALPVAQLTQSVAR